MDVNEEAREQAKVLAAIWKADWGIYHKVWFEELGFTRAESLLYLNLTRLHMLTQYWQVALRGEGDGGV